jgi:hypothetical protein
MTEPGQRYASLEWESQSTKYKTKLLLPQPIRDYTSQNDTCADSLAFSGEYSLGGGILVLVDSDCYNLVDGPVNRDFGDGAKAYVDWPKSGTIQVTLVGIPCE